VEDLTSNLDELVARKKGSAILRRSILHKDFVHFGVEGDLAFVVFLALDKGDPNRPSGWAQPKTRHTNKEIVEFNVGNTLTDVRGQFCLPVEQMVEIVEHYYLTGELLDSVDWVHPQHRRHTPT
jgi:hypothetical protein